MSKIVLVDSPAWILNRPKDYNMLGVLWLGGALRNAGQDVSIMSAHEVTSWDAQNRRLIVHPEKMPYCDFLGVSATTAQSQWAKEMAQAWPAEIKILGGPHPTYIMSGPYAEYKQPEYFEGFDYLLTGECDETLPRFVTGDPNGIQGAWRVSPSGLRPLGVNTVPPLSDLKKLKPPAYDLLNGTLAEIGLRHDGLSKPKKFASVVTSRGCPFNCSFCAEARTSIRELSLRQVEGQVSLLALLGVKYVHFYDDTFNLKKDRCKRIADLAFNYGMEWRSALRTNPALCSRELFTYFREHGCAELEFGVEHVSPSILKLMNKAISPRDSERAIKLTQDCGISAYALTMLGFPGETMKTIGELRRWILRVKPNSACVNMFQAVPGTQVWNEPERFGVKLRRADKGFRSTWCFFLENEMDLSIELPTIRQDELIKAHRELTELFHSLSRGCA